MKEQVVISVKDVKKNFKVYYDRSKTIKDLLSRPGKGKQHTREVLKGISFEVKKGEAVALIGKNGCGKSTMLKLLTRIIYPDSGSIKVNGKVSSMLELGAGFHPDMSGRENIYLNASIFGLTRRQIEEKVDAIIAFSELENFIDNPVRTYSSGMYMRLAFSVAINVQAEILLIDEILGVGDVRFQKKCFNKLKEIKNEGVTIVIVSHSMSQIEQICDRSIWICDGVIKEEGEPKEIAQHYYQHMGVYNEEKAASRAKEKSQKEKMEAETKQPQKTDAQEIDKSTNGQPENGKTASGQPESSMSQTDAAENGKSGNGTARTDKAENGKSGNGTAKTDAAESSKSGNDTVRTDKANSGKSGNGTVRTDKANSGKSGNGTARTDKAENGKLRNGTVGTDKTANGQPSETQMNPQTADSNAWMEQVKASERSYAEKSEVEKLLDQIYNLKVWIQELENGKAWLEQHSVDMENHIRDLEEGKAWLEQHSANMEKHIHELEAGRQWQEQHSEDMENYISDLEEGKLWLEQHVEDLETYIRSLEEEE